jgi:flagellar M-ring protein FliF
VQESLGFNKERGDSVRVINAPFRVEPAPKIEPTPIHQQPWLQDLLRAAAAPLALALVALLAIFKLIRPALNSATERGGVQAGSQLDVVADETNALPGGVPALAAPQVDNRLETARVFAKDNPAAVANIVKGWVGGEAA